MADITQAAVELLAHQLHTHATTDTAVIGAEQDVRSWLSGTVYVYHSAIETTPIITPGVRYILQARYDTGGTVNENWIDMITFQTAFSTAAVSEIDGDEAIGQTIITVAADPTAGFSSGDLIYIRDINTLADSEWNRVDYTAAAPTFVIVDGLTVAKDTYDDIWSKAETFSGFLDLSGVSYIRMLVLHSGATGPDIHFKAEMVAATDIE